MQYARLGADGRFAFRDVPTGSAAWLVLQRPGSARMWRAIEVLRGEIDLGTIAWAPARRVEGGVRGADGRPREGVHVTLRASWHEVRFGRDHERRTDDLGRFRFADVEPGAYRLVIERDGIEESRDVEVPADADVDGLVVDLAESRTLTVLVAGDDGRPVVGATVLAGSGRVTTDAAGRARVALPAAVAETQVVVTPPRDPPLVRPARPFDVAAGQTELRVVLQRAVFVRGVVLAADGKPLAGFGVRAGSEVTGTAPDGSFKLRVPVGEAVDLVVDGQSVGNWEPIVGELRGVAAGTEGVEIATIMK
jgi:hypothetical protein